MYDQSDKLARSFTSPTTDLTRQCLSDVPECRTLIFMFILNCFNRCSHVFTASNALECLATKDEFIDQGRELSPEEAEIQKAVVGIMNT
ncbi:hypothetical protein DPMN_029157 [Dreissena polymorpha]|uniref:Uncharacterized protein n=1 Tax=Dreissena polymorpha TaxID=45954 RepID=A0A9D4LY80_DREPO|nr:hypothetical protein DPMN_029137 [Dreissena polymorpha]KAH3866104.1 hypothetical protein DPMN_029157 [Dreissena polymorpha]